MIFGEEGETERSEFQRPLDAMTEQVTPGNPPHALVVVRKINWIQSLTQHPVTFWSYADICAWLNSVALGHLAPVFSRLNGETLFGLSDKMIDELLSSHNHNIKELGNTFEVADKINFKHHLETLRWSCPLHYRCFRWFSNTAKLLGTRIQSDLVTKISARTAESIFAYASFGIAAVATGYVAIHWHQPRRSKAD